MTLPPRPGLTPTVCLLVLAASAAPGRADEADARQILVVSSDPGLQVRLGVEFQILGYQPLAVPDEPALEIPWRLEALAKERAAIAAVRVAYTDAGWQAVVADRQTGKTVLRQLDADAHDYATVALQTVELLRASLLELALPARSAQIDDARPPSQAAQEVRVIARPAGETAPAFSRHARVLAAPAALSSVRGVGPEWLAHAAYRVLVRPGWVLSLAALANMSASPLTGIEGQSRVRSHLAGLGVLRRAREGRLTVDLGLHLWGGATHFETVPAPGYGRDVKLHPVAAAMGNVSTAVAVSQNLQVTVELAAGLGAPWVRLSFDERQAGTWGLPIGYAALGLQYQVF